MTWKFVLYDCGIGHGSELRREVGGARPIKLLVRRRNELAIILTEPILSVSMSLCPPIGSSRRSGESSSPAENNAT